MRSRWWVTEEDKALATARRAAARERTAAREAEEAARKARLEHLKREGLTPTEDL